MPIKDENLKETNKTRHQILKSSKTLNKVIIIRPFFIAWWSFPIAVSRNLFYFFACAIIHSKPNYSTYLYVLGIGLILILDKIICDHY